MISFEIMFLDGIKNFYPLVKPQLSNKCFMESVFSSTVDSDLLNNLRTERKKSKNFLS